MPDRGLAALYQALNNPPGSHLDDETLALIVDAELAGEDVDKLFSDQIDHIETCESCATAYSDLMVMMQEMIGDMTRAAETVSQTETTSLTEEARLLKAAAEPTSERLVNLTQQAALVWNRVFSATADLIGDKYHLALAGSPSQLAEPRTAYHAGNDRLLVRLDLPGSLLHLEAHLSRQTLLTCHLTIQLKSAKETRLAGHMVQIRYKRIAESAETGNTGAVRFNNIPIAALPELEITVGS
ncbi:MAG: hypothetical protein WAM60_16395 [Candidatus Promineifilaceae bacterium]